MFSRNHMMPLGEGDLMSQPRFAYHCTACDWRGRLLRVESSPEDRPTCPDHPELMTVFQRVA
jgi:hypothetical protein